MGGVVTVGVGIMELHPKRSFGQGETCSGAWSGRAITWMDGATIIFGVTAATVVYLCFDRLGQLMTRTRSLQGSA